ncbi:MAG: response regulator transcription factor [bacterium]|nr:response regulator transcription factor [bacterium]
MSKIMIVEDEKELATILGAYLSVEGFETVIANDGEAAVREFAKGDIRMALLDIMLPKVNGIEVCKKIRETSDIPVIMISAKDGEMDKVVALGIGADDYVTKPFSPLELVARVKAQLRRYQGIQKQPKAEGELTAGKIRLNKSSYTAWVGEEKLVLTTKEFELLYFLASSVDQVFSKTQIYEGVWGYTGVCDDNSITVYIKRLREKLGQFGLEYIKTVWGAGYKLSVS